MQVGGDEDAMSGEPIEGVGRPRLCDPGRDRSGHVVGEFQGVLPGDMRIPQRNDELDGDQRDGDGGDGRDAELRGERD